MSSYKNSVELKKTDYYQDRRYKYFATNTWSVRLYYAFRILAGVGIVFSYWKFMELNLLYYLIFGPFLLVFIIYYFVSNALNLFYKNPGLDKHFDLALNYWNHRSASAPSVDIFLPVCGEDKETIIGTCEAVSRINYSNKQVYILDDKGEDYLKTLAARLGFNYVHRPKSGWLKKAGNLRYGYSISSGEFVLVLDADFVPHPDILLEVLPYTADPKVGLVQTAQYFPEEDATNLIERGACKISEDFYRIIQVSRDNFGAGMCVGTNCLYRRSCIADCGGNALSELSEDVETGLNAVCNGWKVKYVPLIVASGKCPDSLQAYFNQQNRWCGGTIESIKHMSNGKKGQEIDSLWQRPLAPMLKLWYSLGGMYYISSAVVLLMFAQSYLILILHPDSAKLDHALFYIPYFIINMVWSYMHRQQKPDYSLLITGIAHSFIYAYAILANITNQSDKWIPSGLKGKALKPKFLQFVFLSNIICLYMFGLFVLVAVTDVLFKNIDLLIPSLNVMWLTFTILSFFLHMNGYVASCLVPNPFERKEKNEMPEGIALKA
jgi:cellulose synthase (UDP-forming)